MTARTVFVIDASLAAKALLPGAPLGDEVLKRVSGWHKERIRLAAPELWLSEVVSVVRQAVYLRLITSDAGTMAVEDMFRLGIEVIPADLELCQRALAWAERLGQSKAYDGFYMALAERLGAVLWSGDLRLLNRARQLGADWVRTLNEGTQSD
jgi:predicted nucleic acid-binding protein